MDNKNYGNILNTYIIDYDQNCVKRKYTILQLICANQFGIVIEFIIRIQSSFDSLNIQDDDGNTPFHLLCKNVDKLSAMSINEEGKTADELTNNDKVHNYYCKQLYSIRKKIFPFKLEYVEGRNIYKKYEFPLHIEWNEFFNLKDSKRNHKTFMHFLCEGDRLSAIEFLIEHGAKISNNLEKSSEIINDTMVNDIEPFKHLFISCDGLYYPTGFYLCYETRSVRRIHKRKISDLNTNEQFIYKETEQIAEYLFDHGSDIILDEKYDSDFNIVTNLIYKLLKKQKNRGESKKRDQDMKGNSNLSMSESETSELEQIINKNNQEIKEEPSSSQISLNGDKTSLPQSTINNKGKSEIELEKPTSSKENELFENKNKKIETSLSTFKQQNKNEIKSKEHELLMKEESVNNIPLDRTNPVRANLNLPVSLWENLRELSILSGKSIDLLCWELLSPNLEEKLKQARGFNNDKK